MSTYTPIASQTLGSATASVTFSSIPQGYTDLILVSSPVSTTGSNTFMGLQYNGDTGSNYSVATLAGNGSSAVSTMFNGQTYIRYNYVTDPNSTSFTSLIMHVNNYSNSTTHKTTLSQLTRASGGAVGIDASIGLWRSTSAINRLTFIIESSNSFASGSTFTLYGIKAE